MIGIMQHQEPAPSTQRAHQLQRGKKEKEWRVARSGESKKVMASSLMDWMNECCSEKMWRGWTDTCRKYVLLLTDSYCVERLQ
jgi:hypothetical protein